MVKATSADRGRLRLWPLALLAVSAPAWAADEVAVLPVRAHGDAARTATRILQQLTRQGLRGVDDVTFRQRLVSQPGLRAVLARARRQLHAAEAAQLRMERRAAVTAARRAIDSLNSVAARLYLPGLYARAQMSLGLALMLSPSEEVRAEAAMTRALSAAPGYRPDRDRFAPEAMVIYERARVTRPAPRPPDAAEARSLAALTPAVQVLWLAVVPRTATRVELHVALVDCKTGTVALNLKKQTVPGRVPVEVVGHLKSHFSLRSAPPPAARAPEAGEKSAGSSDAHGQARAARDRRLLDPPPQPQRKPWYHTWWVWTLAAVAVVGTGVGVGLALSRDDAPPTYELSFRFPQ